MLGLFKTTKPVEPVRVPAVDDDPGVREIIQERLLVGILTQKDVLRLLDGAAARNGAQPRRVPILDDGGRLVGTVSRADLALYILKNRSVLFQGQSSVGVC